MDQEQLLAIFNGNGGESPAFAAPGGEDGTDDNDFNEEEQV
jgi:hypothetical protein